MPVTRRFFAMVVLLAVGVVFITACDTGPSTTPVGSPAQSAVSSVVDEGSDHSTLSVSAHVDLHVAQVEEIKTRSVNRFIALMESTGVYSAEELTEMRLEMEAEAANAVVRFRQSLTDELTR